MKKQQKGQVLIEAIFVITFCMGLLFIANLSTQKFKKVFKKNETFNQRNQYPYGKNKRSDY